MEDAMALLPDSDNNMSDSDHSTGLLIDCLICLICVLER